MRSYKTNCPRCNRHTFYVTPWNETGYCFSPSCHYLERNNTFAPKKRIRSDNVHEIREFYTMAAKYYHSCLTKESLQFLYKRGFNDDTIKDRMIGYVPCGRSPIYRDSIAKEAGLGTRENGAFLGGRVAFPYFKTKYTIIDIRGRSIDPNEDIKYKSPFQDSFYRGAVYPYNYDLRDNARIILTEGEIKADIAFQIGFPCMALPGMGVWRSGLVQEDGQQFIILFDTQENQKEVIAAIRKVVKHLDDPLIATLPLLGGKKIDIDVFILQYGKEIFTSVIDSAIPYTKWDRLQAY